MTRMFKKDASTSQSLTTKDKYMYTYEAGRKEGLEVWNVMCNGSIITSFWSESGASARVRFLQFKHDKLTEALNELKGL